MSGFVSGMSGFISLAIIAIIVIAIVFFTKFFKFKGKAVGYQERLKKAKSLVRIEQNRYLKTVKNAAANQNDVANHGESCGSVGYMNGDIGSAYKYGTGSNMISTLASAYRNAQEQLNEVIMDYNVFIGKFPNKIFAAMCGLSKEEYIDEENLDSTTTLSELDIDSI